MKALLSTIMTGSLLTLPLMAADTASAATADATSLAIAAMALSLTIAYAVVKKMK